jgi:alkylation response protein AidB-like acyl-CoA dehydrogenase
MTTYQAPITDMLFDMYELAGMSDIAQLPGYEEATPDLVAAILEEVGKLSAEVLAPLNIIGDQQGSKLENGVVRTPDGFKDAYRQFVDGGWNSLTFGTEFGGQGLPWLISAAVHETVQSANMAFGLCPMLTQGAVELLTEHGSQKLKATYLANMVSGVWPGTMNLTEPSAGTDLSRIITKATPDGDSYRLSGTKIYITYGEHDLSENIIHMVLARLEGAPEGIKGISLFVVPKFLVNDDGSLGQRNDLMATSLENKLGIHASPTAVMSYGDNDGAVGYLVGKENHGLTYMFTMMNNERIGVGIQGVGIAERAYQKALGYARERVQSRKMGSDSKESVTIIQHPDVKRMLLLMKSKTEASRALVFFVTGQLDISKKHPSSDVRSKAFSIVDLLTPVVKAWCSDNGIEIANTGLQVHGGIGFIEESGAPQHLRDARISAIYEGTNGIQANDLVGRKIGRDGGKAIQAFIQHIRPTLDQLSNDPSDDFIEMHIQLKRAIAALSIASSWIVETFPTQPTHVAAGAVPYLELLGRTTGGWLLASSALIAKRHLAENLGNPEYLKNKILLAQFFANHVLIETESLSEIVFSGFKTVEAANESSF